MKIINTSRIPNAVVRAAVRFAAKDREVEDFVSEVKVIHTKTHPLSGHCTSGGRIVLIRIGDAKHYPHVRKYPRLKTGPTFHLVDPIEALVKVAAHEFQHTRQFRFRTRKSEVEADRCALYTLTQFRAKREEVLG